MDLLLIFFSRSLIQKRYCAAPLRTQSEISTESKSTTLLAKTGIRRRELITLGVDDIDLVEQSIRLKPAPKTTNRIVFFDDETAFILKRWLRARASRSGGVDGRPIKGVFESYNAYELLLDQGHGKKMIGFKGAISTIDYEDKSKKVKPLVQKW